MGRFAFVANLCMPITYTDATAPVKAGVCDGSDGLHHDTQAGFLYDCP